MFDGLGPGAVGFDGLKFKTVVAGGNPNALIRRHGADSGQDGPVHRPAPHAGAS
jgi:hypothetical protein